MLKVGMDRGMSVYGDQKQILLDVGISLASRELEANCIEVEVNLHRLEKQSMLLTAEPFLWPKNELHKNPKGKKKLWK